jgi:hypothetical protein
MQQPRVRLPRPQFQRPRPRQRSPAGWTDRKPTPSTASASRGRFWNRVGQRRRCQQAGADRVWRHVARLQRPGQEWRSNTLLRTGDSILSDGITVPDPTVGDAYSGSPVANRTVSPLTGRPNFSRQIVDSLGLVPTEVTVIPTAGVSVAPHSVCELYVRQAVGQSRALDDELLGNCGFHRYGQNWTVNRSTIRPAGQNSVP